MKLCQKNVMELSMKDTNKGRGGESKGEECEGKWMGAERGDERME